MGIARDRVRQLEAEIIKKFDDWQSAHAVQPP
jgi:hypothetical protein